MIGCVYIYIHDFGVLSSIRQKTRGHEGQSPFLNILAYAFFGLLKSADALAHQSLKVMTTVMTLCLYIDGAFCQDVLETQGYVLFR